MKDKVIKPPIKKSVSIVLMLFFGLLAIALTCACLLNSNWMNTYKLYIYLFDHGNKYQPNLMKFLGKMHMAVLIRMGIYILHVMNIVMIMVICIMQDQKNTLLHMKRHLPAS